MHDKQDNDIDYLFRKYPKSVPILLNPCNKFKGDLKRKKFIVPKEYTFSKFVSVVRSKCELDETQGLFFFVNGTLPAMNETMGQIYDRWRLNDDPSSDTTILVVDMRCENTFGGGDDNHDEKKPCGDIGDSSVGCTVDVVIDNRETDLMNLLRKTYPMEFRDLKVEQLPIGDIIIRSQTPDAMTDASSRESKIHYVFERKTMRDLRASIRDGRWKEQKDRLTTWFPKDVVVYIIEKFEGFGEVEADVWTNVAESAQISGVLNTMFRDGIKVVCTRSLEDTVHFLHEFATRCPKYIGGTTETTSGRLPTLEGLKSGATRKQKITKDNIFQLQLCQIPGVSGKISEAFKLRYPKGFSDIFEEYNRINEVDDEKKSKLFAQSLKDIPINYDCNKRVTRKLGIRTAQNIINHLLLC